MVTVKAQDSCYSCRHATLEEGDCVTRRGDSHDMKEKEMRVVSLHRSVSCRFWSHYEEFVKDKGLIDLPIQISFSGVV